MIVGVRFVVVVCDGSCCCGCSVCSCCLWLWLLVAVGVCVRDWCCGC